MKLLSRLICVAAMLFAQTPGREIPPYEGDDNPQHDGQPKWCQREDAGGFKKNCDCGMKCDRDGNVAESSRCKTYCRKTACGCHGACVPTERVRW